MNKEERKKSHEITQKLKFDGKSYDLAAIKRTVSIGTTRGGLSKFSSILRRIFHMNNNVNNNDYEYDYVSTASNAISHYHVQVSS